MRKTCVKKQADWCRAEEGIAPASLASLAQRARHVRNRRVVTTCACLALLASILAHFLLGALHARAYSAALQSGENCGPLLGRYLDAVVVEKEILWHPRYTVDINAVNLIRTREKSRFCATPKSRIRQKHTNISHLFNKRTLFSDNVAVCVMHFSDYFNKTLRC
jgi:hypothetical protein